MSNRSCHHVKTSTYGIDVRPASADPWPVECVEHFERANARRVRDYDLEKAIRDILFADCLVRLLEDPVEWLGESLILDRELPGFVFLINAGRIEPEVMQMRLEAERLQYNDESQLEQNPGAPAMSDAEPTKLTMTVEVEDVTDSPDAFTTDQISKIERESLEYWSKLSEPEQRALAVIARDCLIRLLENPLEWLPTTVTPKSGMRVSMFIYFAVDTLEKKVVEMREAAELELYNQVNNLAGLSQKLQADVAADEAAAEVPTTEAAGAAG